MTTETASTNDPQVLYDKLKQDYDQLMKQYLALKEAYSVQERALSHAEILAESAQNKVTIMKDALEKYSDKNFWIRVPTYSLASADKGQMAKDALRMAYEGGSANA